jgi:hypothetical protein
MPSRTAVAAAALLAALAACGCGGRSNPVAGTVTRDGAPVPAGQVRFTPDIDKGNRGPSVTLAIKGGKFSSAAERRPMVTGEHLVTVFVVPPQSRGEMRAEEFTFPVTVPEGGKEDFAFEISKRAGGG